MKYLLVVFAVALISCGECDNSTYYQIKRKSPDGDSPIFCRYEVDGLGACASWQKTQVLFFTDSCSKFPLSKILTRAQVDAYTSKQGSTGK